MFEKGRFMLVLFLMLLVVSTAIYAQVTDTVHFQNKTFEYDTVYIPADTIKYVDTVYMYYEDTLQNKINLQAEVFFSPFFFSGKTPNPNSENDGYGQFFENAHIPGISYTYGANLSLMHKSILFQTGVNYTQFNEDFDYKSPFYPSYDTSVYFETDTLDAYYIVEGIDTTWFYITEENEYTKIDTIQNQNHYIANNSYSYFEFPLVFGYSINKNRFLFLPKAGIIIGVLNQAKGKVINSGNYQEIDDLNDFHTLSSIPVSMYFGLGIEYHILEKAALFAEPYYRCQINSMYRNDFPVSWKTKAYGVKFGVVFKI